MKKLFKVLGTQSRWLCAIAMLALLVLSFAACDDFLGLINGDDADTDTYKPVVYTGYGADGAKYELIITKTGKAVVLFTPEAGDSFTLTITTTGTPKISSGQITAVSATAFKLKHTGKDVTFNVTVSANSPSGGTIVSITDDIPIDTGTGKVTAPGTLTSQPPARPTGLTGTTWKAEYEDTGYEGGGEYSYKYTYTLNFTTSSAWTMEMNRIATETGEETENSATGTYTVNGNMVVLTPNNNTNNTGKLTGVISGNTIVFYNTLNGDDLTFYSTETVPTITTASLPNGAVGIAYSKTLAAIGETPIAWSIEAGTLPPGLSLTGTTGVISGTPTTAATSTFTVKATNSKGSSTKQLSITITQTPTFNSIADFKTWLGSQQTNTADTAYTVKLNVSNLGGDYNTAGSAGKALKDNSTKYVNLDLSGSTFTSIVGDAFYSCTSLASVTIGSGVNSIGNGAFSHCTKLTAINVDTDNTAYSSQDGVLYNKNKTTLVQFPAGKTGTFTIPASVTSIVEDAFSGCSGLTSVTIGSSVTGIGDWAFYGCTSFTSITIPNSVTSIGEVAFGDCTSLTTINVDTANNAYSSQEGVLYNKDKTTLVQYPAGKTDSTFTIPASVTSIRGGAFYGCSGLTSVTIPSNVTSIGGLAFYDCTSLTSVTFEGTIASANFADGAFGYSEYSGYIGDLRDKYLAESGGIGTYTRTSSGTLWTKQP